MTTSLEDLSTKRSRSLGRRVALSGSIALLLAFLVIEVGSRLADGALAARKRDPAFDARTYKPGFLDKIALDTLEYGTIKRAGEQSSARNVPHPYLGYALTPGFHTPPGAPQQASHNSLGFRGRETTWAKPPGVFRIVTTGGSSVYGQSESADAAVWSQKLEDDLRAARPGANVEVINVGCNGWSSFEMLINLELRALDFQPDVVLVYEAINDMRCALYRRGGVVTRDNLQWRAQWPVDRPSSLERGLAHSRTYLVWRRYLTDYVAQRSDLGFYAITNYDPLPPPEERDFYVWYKRQVPIPELGFDNYRRNVNNIISVCAARGAQVLLATQALPRWHLDEFESRNEQKDAFERIQNIEREVARDRGVALFECARIVEDAQEREIQEKVDEGAKLHPEMDRAVIEAGIRKSKSRDLLFFSEVHPNDRGSALIAHTIAEYLLASDLMPK